jgi:Leucine-rich repeat (LRR) protein
MDILEEFPYDIIEIDISYRYIEGSLDFNRFTKLTKLNCNNNQITSLDNLPNSLIELKCGYNKITCLNNLSNSLINSTRRSMGNKF